MPLTITTLAERPHLADAIWAMANPWPEFMRHDPIGGLYYSNCEELFADFVLVATDDRGEVAALAHSIPFVRGAATDLPVTGWGGVIRNGVLARFRGQEPDAISAVEIVLRTDLLGAGLSGKMLAAMRDNAERRGFTELVAPVRPNGKADVHEPMSTYAFKTRADGLPVDPWLRVHVRAGGRIDSIATRSMCIPGTLEEWREWTGLPFDTTGPVEVPQALAPVWCDLEHGTATYVEPNVWVRHSITS